MQVTVSVSTMAAVYAVGTAIGTRSNSF